MGVDQECEEIPMSRRQRKPKESFDVVAYGRKLELAASQGVIRWTALIARPRRGPN
jgi:hypothetical protein